MAGAALIVIALLPIVASSGQDGEAVVVLRVPERRGTYPYSCTPHAKIMRGHIQVE
jgi:plastocyanin